MYPRDIHHHQEEMLRNACRFGLFAFGVLISVLMVPAIIQENSLFLQGGRYGMADDLQTFLALPQREIATKYADPLGNSLFFNRRSPINAVFVPSEEYAFRNVVVWGVVGKERRGPDPIVYWGWMLLVMYLPLSLGFGYASSFLAKNVCRSARSVSARREFVADRRFRWSAFLPSTCCTLVLALLGAWLAWSPAFGAHDITFLELAIALVLLAYFGGLYLLMLRHLVDVVFLLAGLNPLRYLWDEVLTLLIAVPVLFVVYKNSWLTIAMTIAGGLGTGFMAKWEMARERRSKTAREAAVADPEAGSVQ